MHNVSPQIIHGDLKGANVLVNNAEEACLTDFGLSKIDEIASSTTFSTSTFSATVRSVVVVLWFDRDVILIWLLRWMSREMAEAVSDDVFFSATEWSDIWAYGCVILEVFCLTLLDILNSYFLLVLQIISGQVPYYDKKNEPSVLVAIAGGKAPKIPDGVTIHPELQSVMEKCWAREPSERPSMTEITRRMSKLWNESDTW